MQNHYNLLYREDERELIPICDDTNISRTSYSPLAGGRLSRPTWSADTLRSKTDKAAANKYDSTKDMDMEIVKRVDELAKKKNVSMTQIALAWQLAYIILDNMQGLGTETQKYFRKYYTKWKNYDKIF